MGSFGLELSKRDRQIYGQMRKFNGLMQKTITQQNILRIKKGIVWGPCADGHQFSDMYGHLAHCCIFHGEPAVINPLPLVGGPLLVACEELQEGHPVRKFHHWQVLRIMKVKKTFTYFPNVHAPCAVAYEAGFDLREVLHFGLLAQKMACEDLPNEIDGHKVLVGLLLQIDLGEDHKGKKRKKTYKIDPLIARKFLESK